MAVAPRTSSDPAENFAPATVPPSIDGGTVWLLDPQTHEVDKGDADARSAAACLDRVREAAIKTRAAVLAIHADPTLPVGARHATAAEVATKMSSHAAAALETLVANLGEQIARTEAAIVPPKPSEAMQIEIAKAFAALPSSGRSAAIDAAARDTDSRVIAALVHAPRLLTGLDNEGMALIRLSLLSQRPEYEKRLKALSKALDAAERAQRLLASFVEGQSDQSVVAAARRAREAIRQAG